LLQLTFKLPPDAKIVALFSAGLLKLLEKRLLQQISCDFAPVPSLALTKNPIPNIISVIKHLG
jgi:hypothetical protein